MRTALLSFAAIIALCAPAHATDYLGAYTGYFDVAQKDDTAAQFGLEYRYKDIYYGLRPGAGLNFTSDDAVYAYGGLFWDIYPLRNVVFTPNFSAGLYDHGNGKKLGSAIEFRSGLELSYQFENESRLGMAFNHVSNASIGNHNPGVETLLVIYQHPIHWLD